jgi:hypothetical protein
MKLNRKTARVLWRSKVRALRDPAERLAFVTGGHKGLGNYRMERDELICYYRAGELEKFLKQRGIKQWAGDQAHKIMRGEVEGMPYPPAQIVSRVEQLRQRIRQRQPGTPEWLIELATRSYGERC